jgi:transcriptional regulator with XRE-family HTH domain
MGYHNLTLRDVSAVTGAAISTVGTWRNGRVPSARQTVEAIAQLFKVSPAYLVYGITQNSNEILLDSGPEGEEITAVEHYISQKFEGNSPFEIHKDETPRQKIERYIARYLDEAEGFEGGLEHMWLHLLREFPLNWFSRMEYFVERKQSLQ